MWTFRWLFLIELCAVQGLAVITSIRIDATTCITTADDYRGTDVSYVDCFVRSRLLSTDKPKSSQTSVEYLRFDDNELVASGQSLVHSSLATWKGIPDTSSSLFTCYTWGSRCLTLLNSIWDNPFLISSSLPVATSASSSSCIYMKFSGTEIENS